MCAFCVKLNNPVFISLEKLNCMMSTGNSCGQECHSGSCLLDTRFITSLNTVLHMFMLIYTYCFVFGMSDDLVNPGYILTQLCVHMTESGIFLFL